MISIKNNIEMMKDILKNEKKTICLALGTFGVFSCVGFSVFRRKLLQSCKFSLRLPKVYVVSTLKDWSNVSQEFSTMCLSRKVLGMDCEWVTEGSVRKPIAILQLATSDDICLLIRLNYLAGDLPSELKSVLENRSILKVGVAIKDDSNKLSRDYGLTVNGCLDLRYVVDRLPGFSHLESRGLKELVKSLLDSDMDKSFSLRCSNWENPILSPRQIKYAAEDVVGSVLVFKYLMTVSNLQWWSWRLATDDERFTKANVLCGDTIDLQYSRKAKSRSPSKKGPGFGHLQGSKAYSTRSKPLYHNSQLQAPDGEPLCTCDIKKAQWYLDRGLGYMISDEPLVVRLKFEPAGRPILDNKYYIQEKENRCVVCGETENVLRKTVVPHEYRRYFPNLMKEHLSHDILLLCVACHIRSNTYDSEIRQELAEECDAPIGCQDDVKCREDPRLKKVKSAGRALLKSKERLPFERVKELEEIIREYYCVVENEALTEDIIERASSTEAVLRNNGYIPHGKKVVEVQSENDGLMAFETRWRKHFLESMKPKYMPDMWSVDHNHERLVLQVTTSGPTDFDPSILGNVM